MTRRKVGLISILVVLIVLGAGGFYWYSANGRTPSYRTASVERGELISTISSTGTLNAVVTVQVGTQVSGTIQQLLVDFNSPVKKGMLIARIDASIFDAKANQAQADLAVFGEVRGKGVLHRSETGVALSTDVHVHGDPLLERSPESLPQSTPVVATDCVDAELLAGAGWR